MYGARHFQILLFATAHFCHPYDFFVVALACSGVERTQRNRRVALTRLCRARIRLVICSVFARAISSMALLADGARHIFSFAVVSLTIHTPNQSLQPTALWRCASMSILISVSSTG